MSQIYNGTVVAIDLNNNKTATVELVFNKIHHKYYKPVKWKKEIKAHNENYELKLGDKVTIKSSRPYSKTKRFLIVKKLD
jgi:small subunit ribosomal protein S17